MKDDLPALGRPTTANDGILSFSCSSSISKSITNSSSKSPVPLPLIAEIPKTFSKPRLKNSSESLTIVVLSTLFTATITVLFDLCKSLLISLSNEVIPSFTSTTKMTLSHSSRAIITWLSISFS